MRFDQLELRSNFTLPHSKTPNKVFTKTVNKYGEPTAMNGKRMFTFTKDTNVARKASP